ncbi:hypothetical protein UM646_01700 [Staphylococcus aureus]|nr:hypothetical protein UM646_01700 [Staphylococcus aureus]
MHAQSAGEPRAKGPLVVRGFYACAKRRRTGKETDTVILEAAVR